MQPITLCPERVEYKKFLAKEDHGLEKKAYAEALKALRERYKLAFHNYFAEMYPYLRFEIGEEKVFWNYNETIGVYEETGGSTVREWVLKLMIDEGLEASANDGFAKNVVSRYRACYPERGSKYDAFDQQKDWFHAANGWVNTKTLVFEPNSPERLSRRISAVVYDPEAECPVYDDLLDKKLDIPKDQVKVIDQYSGLLLTPDITKQKMLALIGKPGCGKSTLIELWMAILGDCATKQSLTDLSGESSRFMGSSFIDRTLCWFDEVEPNRAKMGDKLIGMITAEDINVERKGINGIAKAKNKLKFILTANALPRSAEIGIYRRLILIHLNHSFYDSAQIDYKIKEKLEAEMSGVLNRMLRGLSELHKLGHFSTIADHDELIEDYKTSSNTISEFLEEYFDFDYEAKPISSTVLLNAYKEFTGDKYTQSLTPRRFSAMMNQHGLLKFENIRVQRTTGGQRVWSGLKLKDYYTFSTTGYIRAVEDEDF